MFLYLYNISAFGFWYQIIVNNTLILCLTMPLASQLIGTVHEVDIHEVVISNSRGLSLQICTYGATIMGVQFPDRLGNAEELTLGQTLEVLLLNSCVILFKTIHSVRTLCPVQGTSEVPWAESLIGL